MILQGRDLKLDLSGDDVKRLQGELQQLNASIPQDEIARSTCGVGTRDAVAKLQGAQGLSPNGIVDAATARMLSKLIDALRSAADAPAAANFTVSGRVYDRKRAAVGALN